jgi:hypothetical protein
MGRHGQRLSHALATLRERDQDVARRRDRSSRVEFVLKEHADLAFGPSATRLAVHVYAKRLVGALSVIGRIFDEDAPLD